MSELTGFEMWTTAYDVIQTLRAADHQAVFAGGCVRDLYLCRMPKDIDIATSAKPWEVELLFPKSIAIGKAFGVITVQQGPFSFEIATFRKDGHYEDGRHPESVEFCEMEEDAARRDFTINSLFYDPVGPEDVPGHGEFRLGRMLDFVGGIEDLSKGVVRFIGDPLSRIREDKLRMLRAIRFAARYKFEIDPVSMKVIWNNASSILQVSAERIREEILKILCSPDPYTALQVFMDSGLLSFVLPEVSQLVGVEQGPKYHPEGDSWEHTKYVVSHIIADPILRMAALLHDIGKPQTQRKRDDGRYTFYDHENVGERIAQEVLLRLKCPNEFIAKVTWLVRNHMKFFHIKNMKKATLIRLFRQPHFLALVDLHYADIMGSNGDLSMWTYANQRYEELRYCLRPAPLINGDTLIEMGFTPSPLYGSILKHVESLQLEGNLQTPEQAKSFVETTYGKEKLT